MTDQRRMIREATTSLPTSCRRESRVSIIACRSHATRRSLGLRAGTLAAVALAGVSALAGATAPAAAQQAHSAGGPAVRPASTAPAAARREDSKRIEDPKLIFEREVFVYPAANRRDPFAPLGTDGIGPLFEELSLRMIIFSEAARQSVAVLADGSKRSYRLRRGETLGNATVVEISPTRAIFVVEDYGNRRREVLDLRPNIESGGA